MKNMPDDESRQLFKGAFILTIAAILSKILSAGYRVPFQNIVGDIGFYIYQQVYPFYGIAIVLATYGYPVIISKLYREQLTLGNKQKANGIVTTAFILLLFMGILAFLLLYYGSGSIANMMGDPQLAFLLKVISVVFLIIPFVSILRGVFQGSGEMKPTALSQVGEQFIRVLTILVLSFIFMKSGEGLYKAGAGATFGSITGGLTALFILVHFLLMKNGQKNSLSPYLLSFKDQLTIVKILLIQGVAICISSMLLIMMQLIDSFNLYSLLVSSGVPADEGKRLKGIYDRGQPLIQLGTVVATSLSLSLVPLISEARMKERPEFLIHKIRVAMKISLIVGLGAAFGLMAIIEPTNIMLFENNEGSNVLMLLSLTIFFSSMILTVAAILQGLGMMVYPAIIVLIGILLKFSFNIFLIPSFGTKGAAISSIVGFSFIIIILLSRLRKTIKSSIFESYSLWTALSATAIMFFVLKGYLNGMDWVFNIIPSVRIAALFQAFSGVIIGGGIFLFIVIRGRTFKEEELSLLPFGSKLIKLLPKTK